MRQYFQQPKFAKVGKLYQDLPIDAITQASEGWNKMYKDTQDEFNKTDMALAALEVGAGDNEEKKKKIKALRDGFKEYTDKHGVENSAAFVHQQASNLLSDEELTQMQTNYKTQQEDLALEKQLRAQGITPIDARSLYNKEGYMNGEFRSVIEDEFGNRKLNTYKGGVMRPGEYIKTMSTLFDNIPEKGNTYRVPGALPGTWIEKTWKGLRDSDMDDYMDYAMSAYKGTNEYQTQLVDLATKGVEDPAQADQMIREQMRAVAQERVNVQSSERTLGYDAALTAQYKAAEEAQGNDTNFFIESPQVNKGTDWELGMHSEGSVLTNRVSNMPVESDKIIEANLKSYWSFDGSDTDRWRNDDRGIKHDRVKEPLSQQPYKSIWVDENGQHVGGGDNGGDNEYPKNPQVYDKDGGWYVDDIHGTPHSLREVNVAHYVGKESGVDYYEEIRDRSLELRAFGPEGLLNTAPIPMGARSEKAGGTVRHLSQPINSRHIGRQVADYRTKSPQLHAKVYNRVKNDLDALSTSPLYENNPQMQEALSKFANSFKGMDQAQVQATLPLKLWQAFQPEMKEVEAENPDGEIERTRVLTPTGEVLGRLLNDVLGVVEYSGQEQRQTFKPEINKDRSAYNPTSMGSPLSN